MQQSILDEIVFGVAEQTPPQGFETTEFGHTLLRGPEAQLRLRIMQLEDDRAIQDERINKLEKAVNVMVKAFDDRFKNLDNSVDGNTMFRFRIIHTLVEAGLIPEHTESDPKAVPAALMEIIKSVNDIWDFARTIDAKASRAHKQIEEVKQSSQVKK